MKDYKIIMKNIFSTQEHEFTLGETITKAKIKLKLLKKKKGILWRTKTPIYCE